jgi:hypothetical protein
VIPLKISDSNFFKSDPSSEEEDDPNDPESGGKDKPPATPTAKNIPERIRQKIKSVGTNNKYYLKKYSK